MPDRVAHPGLYEATGGEPPSLCGRRCRSCGYVFFPPHDYGCGVCGTYGNEVEAVDLAGTGRLHAFATVHLHPGGGIRPPFTIGVIILDDGPTVEATLTCSTDADLSPGDRVQSVLVSQPVGARGAEVLELRFAPVDGPAAGV